MDSERQRLDSTSELPQQPGLRSIEVSVKAPSRLRSGSGGVLFPSGSGRVRRASESSVSSLGGSRARSGSVAGQWAKTTLHLTETSLYYEAPGQVSKLFIIR